eukprot:jgi/Chlat1/8815/Chrsp90S08149
MSTAMEGSGEGSQEDRALAERLEHLTVRTQASVRRTNSSDDMTVPSTSEPMHASISSPSTPSASTTPSLFRPTHTVLWDYTPRPHSHHHNHLHRHHSDADSTDTTTAATSPSPTSSPPGSPTHSSSEHKPRFRRFSVFRSAAHSSSDADSVHESGGDNKATTTSLLAVAPSSPSHTTRRRHFASLLESLTLPDSSAGIPDRLAITKGSLLRLVEVRPDGWWLAQLPDGTTGLVPGAYLSALRREHTPSRASVNSTTTTTSPPTNALAVTSRAQSVFTPLTSRERVDATAEAKSGTEAMPMLGRSNSVHESAWLRAPASMSVGSSSSVPAEPPASSSSSTSHAPAGISSNSSRNPTFTSTTGSVPPYLEALQRIASSSASHTNTYQLPLPPIQVADGKGGAGIAESSLRLQPQRADNNVDVGSKRVPRESGEGGGGENHSTGRQEKSSPPRPPPRPRTPSRTSLAGTSFTSLFSPTLSPTSDRNLTGSSLLECLCLPIAWVRRAPALTLRALDVIRFAAWSHAAAQVTAVYAIYQAVMAVMAYAIESPAHRTTYAMPAAVWTLVGAVWALHHERKASTHARRGVGRLRALGWSVFAAGACISMFTVRHW